MSPLMIEILLWAYIRPEPYDPVRRNAPAVVDGINTLLNGDMITIDTKETGQEILWVTDKGIAWIEHIKNIPWPVQRWEVPMS